MPQAVPLLFQLPYDNVQPLLLYLLFLHVLPAVLLCCKPEFFQSRGRAADIRDISERLLTVLHGGEEKSINTKEPTIIVADDLASTDS